MPSNKEVVRAWIGGDAAKSKNMSTDGIDLFSYKLRIGTRDADNYLVLYDYTGEHSVSHTTSCHVGLVFSCKANVILKTPGA